MVDYTQHTSTPRARVSSRARRTTPKLPTWPFALRVAVAVAAVLLLVGCFEAATSVGRVHPGVKVAGVNVGGKSPAEAKALLAARLPVLAGAPVTVKYGKKTWAMKPADLGVTFDYPALVGQAMQVGRSGGLLASAQQRLHAWTSGSPLTASATADPAKLQAAMAKVAHAVDVDPSDAKVRVTTSGATLTRSSTGVEVQVPALKRDVLAAFSASDRVVAVRTTTIAPRISDATAERARAIAQTMVSAPVKLTYRSKSWTLSVAELARMITVRTVDASGTAPTLEPQLSAAEASKTIVPMVGTALGDAPIDARFQVRNGHVAILPSKDGAGPDVAQLLADLRPVLQQASIDRVVALHSAVRPARLTTAKAEAMGIHDQISTYTTAYSGGVAGRANNIRVLGAALDGKLVAPGETFSVNDAVGERTAAKGYQEANAIVKGELVPQLGGGICQVCTTLFNTVLVSGLPIVERHPHSFYISHYPTGRDATVSWNGPDLRWKNTTSHWVMVSVSLSNDSATAGSISISLYGTNPGYNVSFATSPFTGVKPFKTVTVPDATLAAGTSAVLDAGVPGQKVVVTRTVKRNGALVRSDTFSSAYTPKDATVRVGAKPAAVAKPATTPAKR